MLMALDLPLPETIFGHPWILFDKLKMSKSTGNVMYTDFLVKHFSVDVIRYYVLHEIPYAQDGNITYELLIERNNSDLANTIGNLVNRTIGMVHKYRDGHLRKVELTKDFELNLKEEALSALGEMRDLMNVYKVSDALEVVVKLARSANKFIDLVMPWALFKDETKQDELDQVLYTLMETIRFIAVLLQPYIPETAEKIASFIKVSDLSFESLDAFGKLESTDLEKATVLFERYDMDKKSRRLQRISIIKLLNFSRAKNLNLSTNQKSNALLRLLFYDYLVWCYVVSRRRCNIALYRWYSRRIAQVTRDLFVYKLRIMDEQSSSTYMSIFIIIVNIPILLVGWFGVSHRFTIYSIISVIIQATIIGWMPKINLGLNTEEHVLAATILGGLLIGVGTGGALKYGTSTGGLDILAQYFAFKGGKSVGFFSMLMNVSIVVVWYYYEWPNR